jgi:hypothetical protein
MPTIKSTRLADESIRAAFSYQQKIFELRRNKNIDETKIMEKSRANKLEMFIIYTGVVNANIFD